jgi:hypothetical protein
MRLKSIQLSWDFAVTMSLQSPYVYIHTILYIS